MAALRIDFIAIEIAWFCLLMIIQRAVQKKSTEGTLNFMDQGPWWSVAFHRVWLAYHIPAMVLQLLLNSASKSLRGVNEFALSMPLFHLANYGFLHIALRSAPH
jgi:hypothetical protein